MTGEKQELSCHLILYLLVNYFDILQGTIFIKNTAYKSKSMHSFTFSKPVQWTGVQPLLGRFWPTSRMFDTASI